VIQGETHPLLPSTIPHTCPLAVQSAQSHPMLPHVRSAGAGMHVPSARQQPPRQKRESQGAQHTRSSGWPGWGLQISSRLI
jgi:hypothetical protein